MGIRQYLLHGGRKREEIFTDCCFYVDLGSWLEKIKKGLTGTYSGVILST
jgi:hypothetical protein